eukprot:scaffold38389_cov70-Phaeocystis_antarctica.AAC.4
MRLSATCDCEYCSSGADVPTPSSMARGLRLASYSAASETRSSSSAPSSPPPAWSMTCLASCRASPPPPAIALASLSASVSGAALTVRTTPHAAAVGASSLSPKSTSCLARAEPTSSARRAQPPADGMRSICTSGSQKRACGPAMRASHASAHSNPPATAAPSTTAIETNDARLSWPNTRCDAMCSASAAVGLATRARSAPAQKKCGSLEAKTTAGVRAVSNSMTSRSSAASMSPS